MRCKIGDQAIVVGGDTAFLGWIVTVLAHSTFFPNYWITDRSEVPSGRGGTTVIHFDDSTLQPLRPDLLSDELPTETKITLPETA